MLANGGEEAIPIGNANRQYNRKYNRQCNKNKYVKTMNKLKVEIYVEIMNKLYVSKNMGPRGLGPIQKEM